MRRGANKAGPILNYYNFAFARLGALLGCTLSVIVTGCTESESTVAPVAEVRPAAATSDRKGSVKLSWLAPKTNTDGSKLDDLAGYKIYYGTSKEYLQRVIDIKDPSVAEYTIRDLPPYTYYFVITAYNITGAESTRSNIVAKTVD
jgi:hypothetical protein